MSLLVGSTGFIGSAIENHLTTKNEKFVKIRSPRSISMLSSPSFSADEIMTAVKRQKISFSSIFNASQIYSRDLQPNNMNDMYESNVRLPRQLLEIASLSGAKYFHFSSYLEYTSLSSAYIDQKRAISEILDLHSQDISIVKLVLADTFGPNDRRDKVLNLINQSFTNHSHITLNSPNHEIRLLHVQDLVNSLFRIVEAGTYNFISPQGITLGEIVNVLASVNNVEPFVSWKDDSSNRHELDNIYQKVRLNSVDFELEIPMSTSERIRNLNF